MKESENVIHRAELSQQETVAQLEYRSIVQTHRKIGEKIDLQFFEQANSDLMKITPTKVI
jgi:hypothetical protein